MTEAVEAPALDINVLSEAPGERTRGPHGWYAGGTHNFDGLLKHQVVKDWIDNYTAEQSRSQRLRLFLKVLKVSGFTDPADLLKLNDSQAKTLIKRVAQYYLQHGKQTTARMIMIHMKGFYEVHDRAIVFKRAEKIRQPASKKLPIQYVPSKIDIYKMADVALSLRNRSLILCLFQSGVRVGCLCRWKYGMVAEQLYPEIQLPVEIKVSNEIDTKLAGYGLGYYVTFLDEEAAQSLKSYLEERKRYGWKPKPSDLLFVTESSASQDEPMNPTGVWEIVKSTAELAGLKREGIWTHVLRKAFRKVLNDTPVIPEDMKEALMGHKLPGSRGSYFDYHDVEDVASKYVQANWSRNGSNSRIIQLETQVNNWKELYEKTDDRLKKIESSLFKN